MWFFGVIFELANPTAWSAVSFRVVSFARFVGLLPSTFVLVLDKSEWDFHAVSSFIVASRKDFSLIKS